MRYFIGVDLGTKSAGVAMVDETGTLMGSKQVDIAPAMPKALEIRRAIRDMSNSAGVFDDTDEYHVEDPPYCNNTHTYKILQRLFGAVFHDRQIVEWTPAQIKLAFTGNGRASKEEVQRVAKMQFGLEKVGPDEADAIAVAWTGYSAWREKQRVLVLEDGTRSWFA